MPVALSTQTTSNVDSSMTAGGAKSDGGNQPPGTLAAISPYLTFAGCGEFNRKFGSGLGLNTGGVTSGSEQDPVPVPVPQATSKAGES